MLTRGFLLVGALLFIVLIVIVSIFLSAESLGFWLGISVFVAGWLFTSVLENINNVERHTLDLMLRTRFEEHFVDSLRFWSKLRRNNESRMDEKFAKTIFHSTDRSCIFAREHIANILNFFEIIAISLYYNDADEFLLREYFNDILVENFGPLEHFMVEWRSQDPEAFVYYEWLALRWGAQRTYSVSN